LPDEELKRLLGGFPPPSTDSSTARQRQQFDPMFQSQSLQQWRARAWEDMMFEELIEQVRLTVPMDAKMPVPASDGTQK